MATKFITGGSGFIGRNLIRALRSRGDDVRALARTDAAIARVTAARGPDFHRYRETFIRFMNSRQIEST